MKIIHFSFKKSRHWGMISDDLIIFLKKPPYGKIELSSNTIPLNSVKYLAPATPTKIILCGLNYIDHALELKMKPPQEPVIFLKPPSALIANQQNILHPAGVKRLDYEAELAVVIRKKAKNIKPREVNKFILGYTCLNDVTARDIQKKDGQWTRAKSFDTFCPVGPWCETSLDPSDLRIRSYLNGKLMQDSRTNNFIFPVDFLVSFISKIMTLYPGDVISTGTPKGVSKMKPKDRIEINIQGIGSLVNNVL
ncbi:MAG: fumarylacetoacetate hydrolase family protein [Candidatus Omnitrophica bacterium]|nr:fumarylacetoacetate hydrolase family protein [Candidatus Omnitrophota bacterium]